MRTHEHRWNFLQNKQVFEAVDPEIGENLFRQTDWAYFICNSCPDTGYEPNIIKVRVWVKEALDGTA